MNNPYAVEAVKYDRCPRCKMVWYSGVHYCPFDNHEVVEVLDHFRRQIENTVADLKRVSDYAVHLSNCKWFQNGDTCTCGLFRLLESYVVETGQGGQEGKGQ